MDKNRNYGILMPISSLPSREGIGTLGEEAYAFVDFLSAAGGRIWQILPLNPTNYGDSPYQSCSSDALNYYFIDLALLVKDGLLTDGEINLSALGGTGRRVDYGKQFSEKVRLLRKAYSRFGKDGEFEKFINKGDYSEFALFMALKTRFNHVAWTEWEEPYRTYNAEAVTSFQKDNAAEIGFWQFTQYIFLKQWNALRAYARAKRVCIMGDIPLYVAYDSVEVWKYGGKLFKMDEERRPEWLAGCPPDAFTEDGQLWGNPVYDWEKMRKDGYAWWRGRINRCFRLFDLLRIDHFRGFDRFWQVPAGDDTARGGSWCDGPKEELFENMANLDIVAEDLGVIDDGVRIFMKKVGYPGMKVLIFAFDGYEDNEHKPSNFSPNYVCYTGTHDNMPLRQHIEDLGRGEREIYLNDVKSQCKLAGVKADVSTPAAACGSIIRLAFASVARTVIIPLWDLYALGGEARMNHPSTVSEKNWSWRFLKEDFTAQSCEYLKKLARETGRI